MFEFKPSKQIAFINVSDAGSQFIAMYGKMEVGETMEIDSEKFLFIKDGEETKVKNSILSLKVTWTSQDSKGRDLFSALITDVK